MNYKRYGFLFLAIAALITLSNDVVLASDLDDSIVTAAKQSFVIKTYLQNDTITVTSTNGAVTLTGTVSDESDKVLAKEIVTGLPGVKSVDNRLTLRGDGPDSYSDGWLMAKVKSTLLFHRNVNVTATEVSATDGVVTLRGEATSTAQKDLASELALDVDGVKSVRNEMTVATAQTTPRTLTMDDTRIGEKTLGQKLDVMNEAIDDASTSALVKTTLLLHRSTSALNTTVSTKDGVVTLGGKALTAAEKDLAAKLVSDVHGVKRVVNNMTVSAQTGTSEHGDAADSYNDTVTTSKAMAGTMNDPALKALQNSARPTL
jgi:osmotically-inducible protein OsmY